MTKNYFTLKEQECKCCGTGKFAPDFLDRLNKAREIAGVPFVINSGFRCFENNKKVGGTENSSHLVGCAADISTPDNYTRFKVLYGLIQAGFTRIGIAKNYIHCDDDPSKPMQVSWLYF